MYIIYNHACIYKFKKEHCNCIPVVPGCDILMVISSDGGEVTATDNIMLSPSLTVKMGA